MNNQFKPEYLKRALNEIDDFRNLLHDDLQEKDRASDNLELCAIYRMYTKASDRLYKYLYEGGE